MSTLSTKFAAFAAALAVNGLVMTALGYLFVVQSRPHVTLVGFAKLVAAQQWLS